jgi:hypothetical protein
MSDDPQTWHYGLVARWWAEFNQANPDELAFYRAFVARDGQPALDLVAYSLVGERWNAAPRTIKSYVETARKQL